jgi:hypothetical protein
VGHGGAAAVISMVAVGLAASVYATAGVPSVGAPMPVPLWLLVPPALAMLSSSGVVNSLPVLRPPPLVLVLARLLWLLLILGVGAGAAGLVGATAGYRGLVEAAVLLIALTYASATFLSRGSVIVGGALTVLILTYTNSFANASGRSSLLFVSSGWHWAAGVLAVCGCLVFVYRGAWSPLK